MDREADIDESGNDHPGVLVGFPDAGQPDERIPRATRPSAPEKTSRKPPGSVTLVGSVV